MPASYEQFAAEVDKQCPFDEADGSTAGLARAQISNADCQAKIMEADAQRLAPSQRAALLAETKGGTPSLFAVTADAACNVEGAQLWLYGGTMMAGTMEVQRALGCLFGQDRALAFVMRSWVRAAPADVVSYVRSVASSRPPPKPRLALWRRYAGLARHTAPHQADRDCRFQCRWSDADWIAFERDLDRSEQGATKLAQSLCAEWRELAAAFGGVQACEAEWSSHWLPSSAADSGEAEDPKPDAKADPPEVTLGPPPDQAYDEATLALRRTWAADDAEAAGAAAYLQAVAADVTSSTRPDLERWVKRAEVFRDGLAVADQAAQLMGVSSATAGWTSAPHKNIGATMRLLEGYLLRTILLGKEQDLAAHVRRREAWGLAVETNLGKARDAFKRPCKPAGLRSCEGVSKAGFAQVAARIDWLLTESRALGAALCDGAPELSRALGPSKCAALAGRHLLSFAKYAGDPAMLEDW